MDNPVEGAEFCVQARNQAFGGWGWLEAHVDGWTVSRGREGLSKDRDLGVRGASHGGLWHGTAGAAVGLVGKSDFGGGLTLLRVV